MNNWIQDIEQEQETRAAWKFVFAILAALLAVVLFAGCLSTTGPDAATNTRNQKLNLTFDAIAQKTASVAFQTVLSAAVSQSDSSTKTDYLDGLALGFRSQEGSLITSDDVKNLVSIWTPAAPHWTQLGAQLASTYAQANPQTPAAAATALEAIATGLNNTSEGP